VTTSDTYPIVCCFYQLRQSFNVFLRLLAGDPASITLAKQHFYLFAGIKPGEINGPGVSSYPRAIYSINRCGITRLIPSLVQIKQPQQVEHFTGLGEAAHGPLRQDKQWYDN
jgi:hypothetical protein